MSGFELYLIPIKKPFFRQLSIFLQDRCGVRQTLVCLHENKIDVSLCAQMKSAAEHTKYRVDALCLSGGYI